MCFLCLYSFEAQVFPCSILALLISHFLHAIPSCGLSSRRFLQLSYTWLCKCTRRKWLLSMQLTRNEYNLVSFLSFHEPVQNEAIHVLFYSIRATSSEPWVHLYETLRERERDFEFACGRRSSSYFTLPLKRHIHSTYSLSHTVDCSVISYPCYFLFSFKIRYFHFFPLSLVELARSKLTDCCKINSTVTQVQLSITKFCLAET